jgi:hypothetical protein
MRQMACVFSGVSNRSLSKDESTTVPTTPMTLLIADCGHCT